MRRCCIVWRQYRKRKQSKASPYPYFRRRWSKKGGAAVSSSRLLHWTCGLSLFPSSLWSHSVHAPMSIYRHRTWAELGLAFLLFLGYSSILAEPPADRISGVVLDPQGAGVSSAHVSLLDAAVTVLLETNSDANGNFSFNSVMPGTYQLPPPSVQRTSSTITPQVLQSTGRMR
jgi:hypothetical protein